MLIPIAKVMRTPKQREGILFYDTERDKTKYLKLVEIRDVANTGKYKFAGIYSNNGMVRLYRFFTNVGTLGDINDDSESFTVVEKLVGRGNVRFKLVNTIGHSHVVTREDLVRLIKSGTVVNGVELQKNKRLLVSSEIETALDPDEDVD